jgi:hypothetical protein
VPVIPAETNEELNVDRRRRGQVKPTKRGEPRDEILAGNITARWQTGHGGVDRAVSEQRSTQRLAGREIRKQSGRTGAAG